MNRRDLDAVRECNKMLMEIFKTEDDKNGPSPIKGSPKKGY